MLQQGHVEQALLLSEKAKATISEENRHRERLQFELDFIHQKSGLIYLEETLFDDAFALFLRGRIDPRVIISMFPDVLQQPDLIANVKLFGGVRELLSQRGTLQDISKCSSFEYLLLLYMRYGCDILILFDLFQLIEQWRKVESKELSSEICF